MEAVRASFDLPTIILLHQLAVMESRISLTFYSHFSEVSHIFVILYGHETRRKHTVKDVVDLGSQPFSFFGRRASRIHQ